jgi:hypothetical protein
MVMKYSKISNTVSGFEEVKKFYTWLAGLPPIRVIIQRVFGEGKKSLLQIAMGSTKTCSTQEGREKWNIEIRCWDGSRLIP